MGEEAQAGTVKDAHFEMLRKGIQQEIISAKEHLNIVLEFLNAPRGTAAIMRQYETFFNYTQWAHIKLLCTRICNVTRYNSQTMNIPRLLRYISSHKTLSELYLKDELTQIKNELGSHASLLGCIDLLRDQCYAPSRLNAKTIHTSLQSIVGECKVLFPDLEYIYNFLSSRYDGTSYIFHTAPGINVKELLADLTEYKKLKRLAEK